jgi:hypothetical protein
LETIKKTPETIGTHETEENAGMEHPASLMRKKEILKIETRASNAERHRNRL